MIERGTALGDALAQALPMARMRRASVEPVSQVNLVLHGSNAFEIARNAILDFAVRRAGGTLPKDATD